MRYDKILALAVMTLAWGASLAQAGDTLQLSLEEAWRLADVHSRKIAISRAAADVAGEEVKDARLERLPDVGLTGSAEVATNMPIYENGIFAAPTQEHEIIHNLYKADADFYLNLYNGSKTNLKIGETKLLQQIAEIKRDETISNVHYRTAALYLDLQKSLVFRDLVQKDIADQEEQLKEIEAFHKNGTVLKSDVLRTELDLSRRKMTLVTIENDILIATQKINIILGEPDHRVIKPAVFAATAAAAAAKSAKNAAGASAPADGEFGAYLDTALAHAFIYQISQQQTALRRTNLKQVKANYLPKLGMYGDYWYSNPQIFLYPYNPAWYSLGVAGIKLSVPISEIYHNKHKVTAARLELEKEEEADRDIEDQVRQQVWEAYLRYKESLVQIGVAEDNVAQAEENARIIKNTYFNQASLITDLLDADVQLLRTRFELAADRIAAQDKFYLLQNTIGVL